jgi:hypothetical protein
MVRNRENTAAGLHWRYGQARPLRNEESHVVKTIRDAAGIAKMLGESILLLDRLYLTRPMLKALAQAPGLSVVTKAKCNATAFLPPGKYKGRGAPRKRGLTVKVAELFDTHAQLFKQSEMVLYGKKETVRYFCVDLLWGDGVYQSIRFVLTDAVGGTRSIFASTDLMLAPERIIALYSRRFKIECAFREFKQVVAGFAYHFWSKAMPKLRKFKSNDINALNLEAVTDNHQRELIARTVKAIEGFAHISAIALGMLQLTSLYFWKDINLDGSRFMRTRSSTTPSERTTADFLRKNIFSLFIVHPKLAITMILYDRKIHHFSKQPDRQGHYAA